MAKKKIVLLALVAIVVASSYFFIPQKRDIANLCMDNIEALANNEIELQGCMFSGDLDCGGMKVATIYIPHRLKSNY